MKFANRTDTVSLGASFASAAFKLESMIYCSIEGVWLAGTAPVGTFTLEGSNNGFLDNGSLNNAENPEAVWVTISGSSVPAGGGAGSTLYNVTDIAFHDIRYRYIRTSGTSTGTFYIFAKGFE